MPVLPIVLAAAVLAALAVSRRAPGAVQPDGTRLPTGMPPIGTPSGTVPETLPGTAPGLPGTPSRKSLGKSPAQRALNAANNATLAARDALARSQQVQFRALAPAMIPPLIEAANGLEQARVMGQSNLLYDLWRQARIMHREYSREIQSLLTDYADRGDRAAYFRLQNALDQLNATASRNDVEYVAVREKALATAAANFPAGAGSPRTPSGALAG